MSEFPLSNTHIEVLVAEDNRINQKILKELLRKEGFNATIVSNGKEVLTLLEQHQFDLLILDFHMPELDGLETIKVIRANTDTSIKSIPVFLFTSEQDKEQIQDIQSYGIAYVLQKPVNQAQLSQALKQIGNKPAAIHTYKAATSMDYLQSITSGNTELMIELISIFIEEVPVAIEKIKVYYQNKDWPAIQQQAHKLRSNYKYVGAQEAEKSLQILETHFADDQKCVQYELHIQALEKITSRIIQDLLEAKKNLL